ncbi:RNA polymerase sigma factor [Pseudonocardia sp. 73-21]|uniref:RNA polymerase sigma factor n=1 Tax=Pseudonocardia sp. 73-21 TaxID=1895809 RepID=UPI0009593103|nr:RNA polymerase sigma factor [Pseudonocardia sp. 73-21]OJY46365.1 MAG: hypothetical protein BGP03_27030 [Pseudonocardia sp. 73-21]
MDTEVWSPLGRDELFRRHVVPHIPTLLRAARALTGQLSDAEDLVQDTLIRAYRALHQFDGTHPRAWLLTILRHTASNNRRRQSPNLLRDPGIDLDELPLAPPHDSAERIALGREFDTAVKQAVDDLTDRQRAVVILVDVQGLSVAQAAHRLDLPEGTVMSRLHAARTRMRHRLGAVGVAPRPGDVPRRAAR